MIVERIKAATQMAQMAVAGIFAGIGGFEAGFRSAGFHTSLLCEIDPQAQHVLRKRFPDSPLVGDVRQLHSIGMTDVLCAGFPCQDLSQAGGTAGINGAKSNIIKEVFRAIRIARRPNWVVLENVSFMLHLSKGSAIAYVISELEALGYSWAYRVIDSRCFGLPQRRKRVYIVASINEDPRGILMNEDSGEPEIYRKATEYGFYWTEGNTGVGWARNAIPTLKGGSGLGIPSPPAIWVVGKGLVLPDIRDAERLQGFKAGWTELDQDNSGNARWRLVGNAVSVQAAKYIAKRMMELPKFERPSHSESLTTHRWPAAAWGRRGKRFAVDLTPWPVRLRQYSLSTFLKYPTKPLSHNAASGFLRRAKASSLRFEPGFLEAVEAHVTATRRSKAEGESARSEAS